MQGMSRQGLQKWASGLLKFGTAQNAYLPKAGGKLHREQDLFCACIDYNTLDADRQAHGRMLGRPVRGLDSVTLLPLAQIRFASTACYCRPILNLSASEPARVDEAAEACEAILHKEAGSTLAELALEDGGARMRVARAPECSFCAPRS